MNKRRKGKKRPNTIGNDCQYLEYLQLYPVCILKMRDQNIDKNNIIDKTFHGYRKILCDKNRYCGFEPSEMRTVKIISEILQHENS